MRTESPFDIDNRDEDHIAAVLRARPAGFPVAEARPIPASTSKRALAPIPMVLLTPKKPETAPPRFAELDPSQLLVDDAYQRSLSERSMRMVRRIVANWDWRKFKPPVVARTAAGYEVLDGQHTALAAASHPDIAKIPVMVVEAASQAERAAAFVGQNKDRLQLTPMQLHAGAAAAGDPEALAVNRICSAVGVTILKSTRAGGVWHARDTVAVAAIASLIKRRGEDGALQVMTVLANADCTPISAGQIKAIDHLLHAEEYRHDVTGEGLTAALKALGAEADREAAVFSASHKVPIWRSLAVVLFRKAKRRRGAA